MKEDDQSSGQGKAATDLQRKGKPWTGPVDVGVLQVQRLARVIPQDEWEHRILHEVVEGAARMLVEMGQVLKVGDLSRTPQVSERGYVSVFQQVGQIRGQDVVVDIITELWQEAQTAGSCCQGGIRAGAPPRNEVWLCRIRATRHHSQV